MDNKSYNKAIDDVLALLKSQRESYADDLVKHCEGEFPITPSWVSKHNRIIDQGNAVIMLIARVEGMIKGPETILPDTALNLEIHRHDD